MNTDFHELAVEELQVASDWYAERSLGASTRLLKEVENALTRAARNPEACPQFTEGLRWVRVKRFPYILVIQRLSAELIKVIALAHTSRRPGYWMDRT